MADDLDMTAHLRAEEKFGRRKSDNLAGAFAKIAELTEQLSAHKEQLLVHVRLLTDHTDRLQWLKDEAKAREGRINTLEDIWDMVRPDIAAIKQHGELTYQILESLQKTVDTYLVSPALSAYTNPTKSKPQREDTLDRLLMRERDWRGFRHILTSVRKFISSMGPVLLVVGMIATWLVVGWHWIREQLRGVL